MLKKFNPWRGLGSLPSHVWIICGTTLVNRAGTMVLPFLVLYLTEQLGLNASRAGLALTCYGLGSVIGVGAAGRLSDRFGPVRVMQASLLLSGALLLLFLATQNVFLVFVLTLVWAAVAEAVRPASMAALTSGTPPEHRKVVIAINRLAINLGMSVGPALGGFLAMSSFHLLFVIDGATSLAAAVVLTAFVWTTSFAPRAKATTAPSLIPPASVLRNRRILRKDHRAALMLFYRYGLAGYQLRPPGWIAQFFDVISERSERADRQAGG